MSVNPMLIMQGMNMISGMLNNKNKGQQEQQDPQASFKQAMDGLRMYQKFGGKTPQGMQNFMGGNPGAPQGGPTGAGGPAGGGFFGNPYVWLTAALAYKAYDTKKHGGISYESQLKDPSRAPKSDIDRWVSDSSDIAPLAGKEVYKSTFDAATFDFDDWYKSGVKAPFDAIRKLF